MKKQKKLLEKILIQIKIQLNAHIHINQVQSILVFGKEVLDTEKERCHGMMEANMKVIGIWELHQAKENSFFKIKILIKAHGKIMLQTVTVLISNKMA